MTSSDGQRETGLERTDSTPLDQDWRSDSDYMESIKNSHFSWHRTPDRMDVLESDDSGRGRGTEIRDEEGMERDILAFAAENQLHTLQQLRSIDASGGLDLISRGSAIEYTGAINAAITSILQRLDYLELEYGRILRFVAKEFPTIYSAD